MAKRLGLSFIFGLFILAYSAVAFAASMSPVGTWTAIDDKTNKQRSIVKVWQSKGIYYGRILRVYKQPGDTGFCRKCSGRFKDKPVKGLTILWGVRQTGDNKWSGGRILDPKSGRIYRVHLSLSPNGKNMKVRGYIGFSLFGRTQRWLRRS